jgi:phosphatidylethanolamine-binding protein (PEBP) family uncharacterized protein
MTVSEIKNRIMYQTGNDGEDITDHLPWVLEYVNQGYDRMLAAYVKRHVGDEEYPLLAEDEDIPKLPDWVHYALADFATWCIYRNGNTQRQQRGMRYLASYEDALVDLRSDPAGAAAINFYNIP